MDADVKELLRRGREARARWNALTHEYRWHRVEGGWVYADGDTVHRVEGGTREQFREERKKAHDEARECLELLQGLKK